MNFEHTLRNLGLSLNESKIYLAALELGTSSAQDIAAKANVKRTTAYPVLENLAIKGLVYKTKHLSRNRYAAESPKNLFRRYGRYFRQLSENLPELEAIHNKGEVKPKIIFYEGPRGILKIYADTIKERPKEILEFNSSDMFMAFPAFPKNYVRERLKKKIHARRITAKDKFWAEHAKNDREELSKTKMLDPKKFNLPVEINIYNNKVAFMSYSDKMGVIIESRGIADSMRTIYEMFWKNI
jgi:sugar-specific transcriptional regulator TrmB